MVGRIGDLGFTPNRSVALGLNLVPLANLAVAEWRSIGLLAGWTSSISSRTNWRPIPFTPR